MAGPGNGMGRRQAADDEADGMAGGAGANHQGGEPLQLGAQRQHRNLQAIAGHDQSNTEEKRRNRRERSEHERLHTSGRARTGQI